jgi:DNA-binding CsgD family transcriptional regulator
MEQNNAVTRATMISPSTSSMHPKHVKKKLEASMPWSEQSA